MRIRTRSIIIFLGGALTSATTTVLWMVLVRMIGQTKSGQEIIGNYTQVLLVYGFFAAIVGLQLENSLYYYLPKLGKEQRGTLLFQTLLGSLLMAVVIGAGMFLLSDYVGGLFPDFKGLARLIRIFSLFPFVDRLLVLLPAFMISHDRAVRASVYSLVISVSRILTVVGLFAMGFDLATVLWGVVGVGAVVAVVGCLDMARMCPGRWRLDGKLLLDQLHYVWPLWATTIAGILSVQFDKFLISYNFDPQTLAHYSLGAMELPVVGMITMTLSASIMPELVMMASQGKTMESLDLWQEATRKSSLVLFPCFAFFLVIAPDFMAIMFTEEFRDAAWPFGIFLCLLPLRVAVYGTLFRAIGRTKPIAISAVGGLLANIIIGSTLAYIGGKGIFLTHMQGKSFLSFIGPSIGTVASTFLIGGYLVWQLGKLSGVPIRKVMRWKELGMILALSLACGLFVAFIPLPRLPLLAKAVTQGVIFLAAFALLLWWTGALKGDERQLLLLPVRLFNRLRGRAQTPTQPPAPDSDGKAGDDPPK